MFLFKVENKFMVPGRGLILTAGLRDKVIKVGDKIKLIRPDKFTIDSTIRGFAVFDVNYSVLIDSNLTKEDVPIGTEVWLNE